MTAEQSEPDPEIAAISAVYAAVRGLEPDAQGRVLKYVASKLRISLELDETDRDTRGGRVDDSPAGFQPPHIDATHVQPSDEGLEGISPAAKKWMTRSSLTAEELSAIFSLGTDDIDLVAKKLPGSSKREKLRSVFLLEGIAAFLGTGTARFTHAKVKEPALHYDAFDAGNFAVQFKTLSSEVSGDKGSGYLLTARGLASATELLKELTARS